MNRTREAMVGVVIVGALALTVAGTLWLQGMRFGQDRETLEVVVAQAGQIMPGNSVKYRGVDVGRVGEVSVEPGGTFVRIELLLEQPVALPPDPIVILSPESLFGDWEAEIQSRAELPYGDYPDTVGARCAPRLCPPGHLGAHRDGRPDLDESRGPHGSPGGRILGGDRAADRIADRQRRGGDDGAVGACETAGRLLHRDHRRRPGGHRRGCVGGRSDPEHLRDGRRASRGGARSTRRS